MPASTPTAYDKVLYPSYTRIQTHPDRLATISRLLGMQPAPVEKCRVLELGCGNGSNLVPIAYSLPESEFVGVDLAERPIETAHRMLSELGVKNTTFHQRSISEVHGDLGKFDYIICHGVYSWVPAEVRDAILRVCRESLQPNGIAFVSYNAYPGNRLREMIREMMLFHVHGFTEPREQIEQARALAGFVAAAQDEHDLYRKFLKEEMEQFLQQDGSYVFHDALAEINTPFYFFQFMAAAESRGLGYLGEADFHVMLDLGLPPGVSQKLDELSGNRIAREQYLDFLRCRRFRQTLLCHREIGLNLALKPEQVAEFYIAGFVRRAAAESGASNGPIEQFENRQGARIQTDSALAKTAFAILTDEWPQALAFPELLKRAREKVADAGGWKLEDEGREEAALKTALFRSYAAGLLELHTYAPKVFREVTERPVASPLTRWQTSQANFVSSLFHTAVRVEEPLVRELIRLLDGSRDRDALLLALEASIDRQRLASGAQGKPIALDAPARQMLRDALEQNLAKLSRMGLLVG